MHISCCWLMVLSSWYWNSRSCRYMFNNSPNYNPSKLYSWYYGSSSRTLLGLQCLFNRILITWCYDINYRCLRSNSWLRPSKYYSWIKYSNYKLHMGSHRLHYSIRRWCTNSLFSHRYSLFRWMCCRTISFIKWFMHYRYRYHRLLDT